MGYILPVEPESPLDDNLIVFGDSQHHANVQAVYDYVVSNTSYKAIWATITPQQYNEFTSQGYNCFAEYKPEEAQKYLSTAKYIVTYNWLPTINKRKGQIYVNLNHTITLSKLPQAGYHEAMNGYVDFAASSDIICSSSLLSGFTDPCTLLQTSIAVTGSPRCDYIYNSNGNENLKEIYPDIDNYKIKILYAPSGIIGSVEDGKFIKCELHNLFNYSDFDQTRFEEFLEEHSICVLVRWHPLNQDKIQFTLPKHCYNLQDKDLDRKTIYHILNDIDIMISDVSQLSVEYCLLNRPIIRLWSNIETQVNMNDVGLGNPKFWFPGWPANNQEELEHAIADAVDHPERYSNECKTVRDLVFKYQDGYSARRVVEAMESYIETPNYLWKVYAEGLYKSNQELDLRNQSLINSTSWKLTRPLRELMKLLRR